MINVYLFTFKDGHLYGELFVHCLLNYNMLCLGVYRFRDLHQINKTKSTTPSSKRYVICNPNADFRLMQTDLVYVLQQFDSSSRKMTRSVPKIPDNLKQNINENDYIKPNNVDNMSNKVQREPDVNNNQSDALTSKHLFKVYKVNNEDNADTCSIRHHPVFSRARSTIRLNSEHEESIFSESVL